MVFQHAANCVVQSPAELAIKMHKCYKPMQMVNSAGLAMAWDGIDIQTIAVSWLKLISITDC